MSKPTHIDINLDKCDLCGTCIGICPPNVMSLIQEDLQIDFENCTYCQHCIYICPLRAISGQYN